MIEPIRGRGHYRPMPRRAADRRVDPATEASRAGEGRHEDGGRRAGAVVAVPRPVYDDGVAMGAGTSTLFMAQIIGQAGNPASGERRSRRDPSLVMARARAAYGVAARLVTALEPGFLAARSV